MLDNRHELIASLNSTLIGQRYSPVVARNYCTYASGFLDHLGQRRIPVADASDVQVGGMPPMRSSQSTSEITPRARTLTSGVVGPVPDASSEDDFGNLKGVRTGSAGR